MDTIVIERGRSLHMVGKAQVVHSFEEVSEVAPDYAASTEWDFDAAAGNPYIKWIAGRYVESGKPNSNKQYWTAGDLAMGEYSIKWAPLNMVHKVRQPVGFYLNTSKVFADEGESAGVDDSDFHIEALSGMWSHIFSFEASLVDAADEKGQLFYSMECIGTHIRCEGANGCGQEFEYAAVTKHCEHLRDRASVRHIVNPTFRGGALIIPPVKPGWKNASASVVQQALMDQAALYAEQSEQSYLQARAEGSDLTVSTWENLMATILSGS